MASVTPSASETLQPFCVRRVADVQAQAPETLWLIEDLWLASGVGILGGEPKLGKTYLATEIAVAVATGLDALGCYKTHSPGPILFYGAEGSISALRSRAVSTSIPCASIGSTVPSFSSAALPTSVGCIWPLISASHVFWFLSPSYASWGASMKILLPRSLPFGDLCEPCSVTTIWLFSWFTTRANRPPLIPPKHFAEARTSQRGRTPICAWPDGPSTCF